ncbi:hypothetical protein XFF4834R_chr41950 [Xanthomonas citri pv. fuscans]|nr:hypothetical protein XFF4834R_chr41950 [Xanthomonas citri pv. fuscans]
MRQRIAYSGRLHAALQHRLIAAVPGFRMREAMCAGAMAPHRRGVLELRLASRCV